MNPLSHSSIKTLLMALFLLTLTSRFINAEQAKPNIVWILVEDMSADFGCYGNRQIETPNIDQLSKQGIQFNRAFVTAPICSISRSALITGRYQTSIGAQNHRSSVPGHWIRLREDTPLVTEIFHASGYHVNNLTIEDFLKSDADLSKNPKVPIAKTDYNFEWEPAKSYDETHWRKRGDTRPFFCQIQLNGGKFRGQAPLPHWPARIAKELGNVTPDSAVVLPPYLPDHPTIRADWAQYLDCVRYTDDQVGRILARLRETGEWERTVVFLMTDHGISHVRNKQFLYDGGIHVPLIVAGAGIPQGIVREDLVEHIDLAATSLGLAALPCPASMQSRNVLADGYQQRSFVFAARDRADETVDLIRSVRSRKWKYIRNGFPSRPYLQPNQYKDSKAILHAMREYQAAGKLTEAQSLIMADSRPAEELYDLEADPFELKNLAKDPKYELERSRMKQALEQWQAETHDPGVPETESIYLREVGYDHPESGKQSVQPDYHRNIETMNRWRTERPFVAWRTPKQELRLIHSEFLFEELPHPECHASTIEEAGDGSLVAAWFGGVEEKDPSVGIWVSRKADGKWTEPTEVVNGIQYANADGGVFRYPCWNPVLFQPSRGPLLLFYKVGPSPSTWWGMVTTSEDSGRTWAVPRRLPEGIAGPIKNKPIELENGEILCGSSTEDQGWRIHFELTPDQGRTWMRSSVVNDGIEFSAIQPTILRLADQSLLALGRTRQGSVFQTSSVDRGRHWSPLRALMLPNPNSGLDGVTLRSGLHCLVYNHTNKGRSPLNVATSIDGADWDQQVTLESEPGEFSYPAVIQTSDGLIHTTYTWNRKKIKHAVLELSTH